MPLRSVREMRKLRDMTQKELGEEAGVSGDMISKVERGERWLHDDLADNLAEVFGIDPLELKILNAFRLAEKWHEKLRYKLEEGGESMPGEPERKVKNAWRTAEMVIKDVASAKSKDDFVYDEEVRKKVETLHEYAFKLAKMVHEHRDELIPNPDGPVPP